MMSTAHVPTPGTLYGLSVGPGDPELITVKALRILQSLPVVAFPAGVQGKLGMAQQIVSQWIKPEQIQLALNFPYLHDETILQTAWRTAAQEVWNYLKKGQDVGFVCEGDLSFYSTFTYLAQTLQAIEPQAKVQTVPGICAPMAASAVLGLPLTVKDQRLAILPAIYQIAELENALNWADVVVLMKVSSVYEQVWAVLQERKLLDRAYAVERATLPNQIIYHGLLDKPHLKLPYFSLIIVQVTVSDVIIPIQPLNSQLI